MDILKEREFYNLLESSAMSFGRVRAFTELPSYLYHHSTFMDIKIGFCTPWSLVFDAVNGKISASFVCDFKGWDAETGLLFTLPLPENEFQLRFIKDKLSFLENLDRPKRMANWLGFPDGRKFINDFKSFGDVHRLK